MNHNEITAIIVTFKSEKVIFQCLKSINSIKHIIIFDNSSDLKLKKKVLLKFPKVQFVVSSSNFGYGKANNIMLKMVKTKYVIILNPDAIITNKCICKLLNLAKNLNNKFSIIAPSVEGKKKNYGFFNKNQGIKKPVNKLFFEADFVKGFAMFINLRKIKNIGYFDENFFMYLEEIDLCKRLKDNKEKIFVLLDAKSRHQGGKSSNIGFEFELNRNWHWMWSKLYYSSKHSGFLTARVLAAPQLLKLFFKTLFYIIFFNQKKLTIYLVRLAGLFASYCNLKSYYRPKFSVK
jgi:N-acetylglucosaminyl-diphospho-decaprenol L-rhamnosyltransferase